MIGHCYLSQDYYHLDSGVQPLKCTFSVITHVYT